ncbi:MAG: phosphate ABC transporter permease PstA [Rhodospirillaceae bacterium]|nr:phosphate ABC transporter permease PstA [Rhodospirillaceae bacterium]
MPPDSGLALTPTAAPRGASRPTDLLARGEPFLWGLGGALGFGVMMIAGFLLLVLWNGIATFYPRPIHVVTLVNGDVLAGEPTRTESFRPPAAEVAALPPSTQVTVATKLGFADRTLYRTGNFDLYGDDFRWVTDYAIARITTPPDLYLFERLEWGPFIGRIKSVDLAGATFDAGGIPLERLAVAHDEARRRWRQIREIEHDEIGRVNQQIESERLALRKMELGAGAHTPEYTDAAGRTEARVAAMTREYEGLAARAAALKAENARYTIALADIKGREKLLPLAEIMRFYPANDLSIFGKLGVYVSRWGEFLTAEPREANTEGGVFPAIFGTFAMTLLMVIAVAPFGVITALYLREYATQGRLVSVVRISVNNLAGVPSIVYGVFGLGFFAYIVGGTIDEVFFPERLPNPTFGTGGLLWSALTLALLTVPVVIVATEEALAAVPRSVREGSLACGASKWQTIRRIVLPRAMPGIMTGLILAMARGAGEVAPLMLVGVVKLAPELPIDGIFPYIHFERSFMHLGFHIYDVGFQSRNSEAGKPMVFVTTLLLIALVALMNATAIMVRNRLKQKFSGSQF